MSDIRFIDAQGELFAAAIVDSAVSRAPSRWSRLVRRRPRRARTVVAGVAVAVVIAGCAVAAASGLLSSSQRLALGRVDCYFGAKSWSTFVAGEPLAGGQAPTAVCSRAFSAHSSRWRVNMSRSPARNPTLLACRKSATTAAVFFASGASDQCRQLGLTPLPNDFGQASASARALSTELERQLFSRDCWSPSAFAALARHDLARDGLSAWHVVVPHGHTPHNSPIGEGRCAELATSRPGAGTLQALSGSSRTLEVGQGLSRSMAAFIRRTDQQVDDQLWRRCYRGGALRAVIDRAYGSDSRSVAVATTTDPNGHEGYGSAAHNAHYAAGCPILFESWPSLDARTIYVWLNARHGQYLKPYSGPPPLVDFRH